MKFIFLKTSVFYLTFICCYTLQAKERRICDLEVSCESPKDTVFNGKGKPIQLKLSFRNNGPDKMTDADGIYYQIYLLMNDERKILTQNLLAGQGNDSIPFNEKITYNTEFEFGIQNLTSPITLEFCAEIFSEVVLDNGDSSILAYYDPNKGNNITCNRLTIMPQKTNGIEATNIAGILFQAYPNPVQDILYIQSEQRSIDGDVEIMIRDITGKKMIVQHYPGSQMDQGPLTVNLSSLPQGMYTISMQTTTGISTKKFLISR